LRPSTPPLERKLKSLTLLEAGYAPTEVVNVLMQLLDVSYSDAREVLDSAPVVIFADALPERSEEAASLLKKAGASVQIS
ncbi:MAG TPA: ribosomal protein L7/L12, partial [Candidatus Obscuribacter sp.]|nr:ribosomal protein L7/L12 [Candidatus Obscuribacter sp.]